MLTCIESHNCASAAGRTSPPPASVSAPFSTLSLWGPWRRARPLSIRLEAAFKCAANTHCHRLTTTSASASPARLPICRPVGRGLAGQGCKHRSVRCTLAPHPIGSLAMGPALVSISPPNGALNRLPAILVSLSSPVWCRQRVATKALLRLFVVVIVIVVVVIAIVVVVGTETAAMSR